MINVTLEKVQPVIYDKTDPKGSFDKLNLEFQKVQRNLELLRSKAVEA